LDNTGAVSASLNSTFLLPGGSYQVHAHYAGDGTFLGSDSSPVNVTVTPEASQTSLGIVVNTPCVTSTSVAYGSPYILSVAVADVHQSATACIPNESGATPTGTVTLTDTVGSTTNPLDGGSFKLNSFGYFEDQTIQLLPGTHTIKAVYAGDNSFTGGNSTATVTVTQAATTSTVTSFPTSVAANSNFSLTALVDTQTSANPPIGSSGAAPTGTVTFFATTASAVFKPADRRVWPWPNGFLVGEIGAAMACLFLLALAAQKRRGVILLAVAIFAAVLAASGCGSGGSSTGPGPVTTTLGMVSLGGTTDVNGFAAANATLANIQLAKTATITAKYSGDSNYSASTSAAVAVTVH
jgi:hypothetical protein